MQPVADHIADVRAQSLHGQQLGQSSLLAFLNERLLSATSGHRIDFKDRALMINKSVALPDQIFARPELA
jgi:hypothetical protein